MDTGEALFEDVYDIEGVRGGYVSSDGTCRLPLLYYIVDLVFYDLVLRDNLEL